MRLGSKPYIGNAVGEDSVAILNFAIRVKKADEALIKFSGGSYYYYCMKRFWSIL